jgi:hypothetical protein
MYSMYLYPEQNYQVDNEKLIWAAVYVANIPDALLRYILNKYCKTLLYNLCHTTFMWTNGESETFLNHA